MADVSTANPTLKLEFPEELPISAHAREIADLLQAHPVIVVAGETGSGKTTQLPKICLAAGFGQERMIGHTQPRRLAARSVATRIADELGVELGGEVGYAVRFTDKVSERTRVKLMTDGLLLTEIRRDRSLDRYDVVIVDEAHERSLNVDFLLGYLKALSKRRPDLKIIITSATIDVDAFSQHFTGAPVVEVGGRTYPVTVRYLDDDDVALSSPEQLLACLEDIETGPQAPARDVLVFFPGEREILEAARLLRGELGERMEVLPLYARLSAADQQRVFRPGKRRRVVLATNVAETSITVPNIGYVIDTGTARVSRYSYRSKLQRLPLEPISKASAKQRAGRCGRIAPGVCYRLYTEEDFEGRPDYTDPEIRRTNLASVVLQMRAFRLGDPYAFPFLEPPETRAIRDADRLLEELGALVEGRLTEVGRAMARLPVDPRLARMLLAADRERSLSEVLVIASAMAISDPRDRPLEKRGSADRAHEQWQDERSDFAGLLKLWDWFENTRQELTRARLRRELDKRFLSAPRLFEWRELHRQLLLAVRGQGLRLNTEPAAYSSIHRALLTGSLSLIGQHDEKGNYLGPRNLRFRVFPGSGLAEKTPKWLVAGEIVETRRVYARSVAAVEARWIEEAAAHLVKRKHSEPHWSLKRGEALAFETVTLYGLLLADRRRVSLKKLDPETARSLFLLEGLVHGAINRPPPFLVHNLEQMAAIREEEDKGRRRDLLLEDGDLVAIYDGLIPRDVVTARDLDRWLKKAPAPARDALFLDRAALSREPGASYAEADFPAELELRGARLALKYRFAPGAPDDGVSVLVPIGALNAVTAEPLDWLVPGMFPGVCEAWLRSLPKQHRRRLGPIPDAVKAMLPLLTGNAYRQGRLTAALTRAVEQEFGVRPGAGDWQSERVDAQWRANVQLLAEDGQLLAQGRDLDTLRAEHLGSVEERVAEERVDLEEEDVLEFPAELPATVTLGSGGSTVVAHPALVDEGGSVALRFLSSDAEQRVAMRQGLARLALKKLGSTTRYLKKNIDRDLGLLFAPLGNAERLRDELLLAAAWQCFFEGEKQPETAAEFHERLQAGKGRLAEVFQQLTEALKRVLAERHELCKALDATSSPAFAAAVADIRGQLDALVSPSVLADTPAALLTELPRYLKAAAYRLSHLQGKVARDAEQSATVAALAERVQRLRTVSAVSFEEWQHFRFMLEEVRVGLFAEPLGVRGKASPKRLDRELNTLERDLGLL